MDCHDDDARAEYTHKIRTLNDRLRRDMPHGSVMITHAVAQVSTDKLREIALAIQAFEQFGPGNDPWGEHDFGQVDIDSEAYFWKIDAYDLNLEFASPEPTDEAVTRRILTIMTAHDL
jgi:hypothetical protein